jgi:ADP-heptose:LPS heptosyltransferase
MSKDIVVVAWGGIGDVMICTPTLRAIKERYPDRKLIVYCLGKSHWDVLLHNPHIDSLRLVGIKYMWRYPRHLYFYLFNRKRFKHYPLCFQHVAPSFLYNMHMAEVVPDIFSDLGIQLGENKVQLFLTKREEDKAQKSLAPFEKVIIIQIHSKCSINHHWPMDLWEALISDLPQFTFIQVGLSDEQHVRGAVDWRGKTSLREVFALLKYADGFVGIESSLGHVTNAVDLPGVVLFGDSSPIHWGHENNINIYKGVSCSPCYYYLWKNPCPYGHQCMNHITVKEVRSAILQQMNVRRHFRRFPTQGAAPASV